MIYKSNENWQSTDDQVDKIIDPVIQGISKQCAGYINEILCPLEFIFLMLRNIADSFENQMHEGDSDCSCC